MEWAGLQSNKNLSQMDGSNRTNKLVHFKALADNSDLFEIVFNCETFELKIVNIKLSAV
jgi:hypothetical protein